MRSDLAAVLPGGHRVPMQVRGRQLQRRPMRRVDGSLAWTGTCQLPGGPALASDKEVREEEAIRDGRIAQVAEKIEPAEARRVIAVEGELVVPGLMES